MRIVFPFQITQVDSTSVRPDSMAGVELPSLELRASSEAIELVGEARLIRMADKAHRKFQDDVVRRLIVVRHD